ncbi:MAG TPA: hypothetical protein VJY35_05775 [Candidatus Eisenbacteria bacterium]|nr:hypothetical protein [Candidatus Eisenbacteria bacterium]
MSGLVLAFALAGCGAPLDTTTGPLVARDSANGDQAVVGQPTADLYPLQIGNRWHHRHQRIIRIFVNGKALAPIRDRWETASDIACTRNVNGFDYLVERSNAFGTPVWTALRQDATGLYELPPVVNPPSCPSALAAEAGSAAHPGFDPPASLAAWPAAERAAVLDALARMDERVTTFRTSSLGGPGPVEMPRLLYPIQVGTRWGTWYGATAEVVGSDVLELPAGKFFGHRVRLIYPSMGPADRMHVWYGRAGYLQTVTHLEFPIVDGRNVAYGVGILDESEVLVDLRLAPRHPASPAPWTRF